jgi:hypothetical protein
MVSCQLYMNLCSSTARVEPTCVLDKLTHRGLLSIVTAVLCVCYIHMYTGSQLTLLCQLQHLQRHQVQPHFIFDIVTAIVAISASILNLNYAQYDAGTKLICACVVVFTCIYINLKHQQHQHKPHQALVVLLLRYHHQVRLLAYHYVVPCICFGSGVVYEVTSIVSSLVYQLLCTAKYNAYHRTQLYRSSCTKSLHGV